MTTRWLVIAALAVIGSTPAVVGAQGPRIRAGVVGGSAGGLVTTPTAPDPQDARVLSPAAFAQASVDLRRRTMRAWAAGDPHRAGPAILPLITAGLSDVDIEVQRAAVDALARLQLLVGMARVNKERVVTNPASHPPLRATLVRYITHPDARVRSSAIDALGLLGAPLEPDVEATLLLRVKTDVPVVRTTIIRALAANAQLGSSRADAAVVAAVSDADPSVRQPAMMAMRQLHRPDALPALLRELALGEQPALRGAAVWALHGYDRATVTLYATYLAERLWSERDPAVRRALQTLIDSLPAAPSRER